MSEPGFASLGPTLLARKGGAKPAMRPQIAPLAQDVPSAAAASEDALEDLGWNDMGDSGPAAGGQVVPINADISAETLAASPSPIVHRQQRRLEERVLADAVMTGPENREPESDAYEDEGDDHSRYSVDYGTAAEDELTGDEDGFDEEAAAPSSVAAAPAAAPLRARVPAAQPGRRAAFTLRLDADRHLKLRLAATMQGVSAQTLVTEALDRFLAEYDELDTIANHLKRH